jgi:cell division transport system permease protein
MKQKSIGNIQRRLRSSYITSVISISLVLFMLGLVGILFLNARKISDAVKENIDFSILIKETAKESEVFRLQKELDASRFVKSTRYITREQAAKEFQQELGEDFVGFLGYNPLLSSIDVKLNASYANPDSISKFETSLKKNELVQDVYYQQSIVHFIDGNVQNISIVILSFCGLLFLIAIFIINSTVRLSIYSKRFIINTMQLVGATSAFVRKPFLIRSIMHGAIGGAIAINLVAAFLYWAEKQIGDVLSLMDFQSLFALMTGLVAIGILINLISTMFAVNKYLRSNTNELYY